MRGLRLRLSSRWNGRCAAWSIPTAAGSSRCSLDVLLRCGGEVAVIAGELHVCGFERSLVWGQFVDGDAVLCGEIADRGAAEAGDLQRRLVAVRLVVDGRAGLAQQFAQRERVGRADGDVVVRTGSDEVRGARVGEQLAAAD